MLKPNFYYLFWLLLFSLDTLISAVNLQSKKCKCYRNNRNRLKDESSLLLLVTGIQKLWGWYLLAILLVMFGKIWIR